MLRFIAQFLAQCVSINPHVKGILARHVGNQHLSRVEELSSKKLEALGRRLDDSVQIHL